MNILEQALKSKLPFIHVTTSDLLHIQEVLSYISGVPVYPLQQNSDGSLGSLKHDIYYTSSDIANPATYLEFKSQGKCLVFVNTKPSVLHFTGGAMLPPRGMMLNYLRDLMEDAENAEAALPAFSGMTLKEMYEATRITLHRAGKVTAREINDTRKEYISKLKGIQQVDTKYDFYQCPSYLQDWMGINSTFFTKPVLPSLTPRGLLLDGRPGTGKTAAAKFIASEWGLPLYHLDIGSIKGKYVGDSEASLNAALSQIDSISPCILLLDEAEKAFSAQSDSGVTSSLLGTLLWWLQEHESRVFTVMTTNCKESIPKELYREGRIDAVMVFQGLESQTEAEYFAISVYNNLSKQIWGEVKGIPTKIEKGFLDRLKILFSGGAAVPQVTIVKEVQAMVKTMVTTIATE